MAGRRPVALATGFLDPYDYHVGGGSDHTQARPRSQYVVVVREDWTVMCYDSTLTLRWEQPVSLFVGGGVCGSVGWG